MASDQAADKAAVWSFFLWWYRENYVIAKSDRTLYRVLKPKESRLAYDRFKNAFFYNALIHSGLSLLFWSAAVSKNYSMQFFLAVPYPVRVCVWLVTPPLCAYLRFQDIFYEKELVALAHHWAVTQPDTKLSPL